MLLKNPAAKPSVDVLTAVSKLYKSFGFDKNFSSASNNPFTNVSNNATMFMRVLL